MHDPRDAGVRSGEEAAERRRVAGVYARYAASPRARRRWNAENPGNAAQELPIPRLEIGTIEIEFERGVGQNHYHSVGCSLCFCYPIQRFLHLIQLLLTLLAKLIKLGCRILGLFGRLPGGRVNRPCTWVR